MRLKNGTSQLPPQSVITKHMNTSLITHSNYNDDDDSLVSFKTDLSFFPFMALEGFNFHDLTILNISFTYNAKVRCILN